MISVEEAKERILAGIAPLPPEQVSLPDALGRTLAKDVVSRVTQPPSAVSAMDGYAVRAADVATVPAKLACIGEVPAGAAFEGEVGKGQAVRIFTGASVPAGADAIVIQEDTEHDGDTVTVTETSEKGRWIRPAGLDFSKGDVGLRAGTRLAPRHVGLAAAMNHPWLEVVRKPRVAILATGDEVVLPGDPLGPNQIVSSNSWALGAFVEANGGVPVQLGIAADNHAALRAIAAGAAGADLLVTTGGASVGKHDLVQAALGEAGLDVDFWRIAMRPGKPLIFGAFNGTPFLGLPGNPVSTLVCALIFMGPILARMLGLESQETTRTARLGADMGANDKRQDYVRARLSPGEDGEPIATPYPKQDSSMLSLLAGADCLILRPPQAPATKAGERVPILPFPAADTVV